MNLLITKEEYNKLKSDDLVPAKCILCGTEFTRKKMSFVKSLKNYGKAGYCSRKCSNKSKINHVFLPCEECGTLSRKAAYDTKINKHVFCSYKCHATFKNRNKVGGYNRSAIEQHIESKIKDTFPDLEFKCNDRSLLNGQELDFYFPYFKLAIELNGITHYEPIYGIDRLNRSKESDSRKMINCYEKGIELAIIDISAAKYLTDKWKEVFWKEVFSILSPIHEATKSKTVISEVTD